MPGPVDVPLPPTFDAPLPVPLRHRVTFTSDALDPGNAVLAQVMGTGQWREDAFQQRRAVT